MFATLAAAFGGLLTDAQVEAINRPDWRFTGWDNLAYDDRSVARERKLTRPRIIAGTVLLGQWLGGITQAEAAALVDELARVAATRDRPSPDRDC